MAREKKPVHRVQMTEGKRNFSFITIKLIVKLLNFPTFLLQKT